MPEFSLTETKGDLFTESGEKDALAHCVSKDFHMSKGIAVDFKTRFKGVDELLSQDVQIGKVGYLDRKPRAGIFYLVTKKKYWGKPTMDTLHASLVDLKRLCMEKKVTVLSMPKIGCGLDKLRWGDVCDMIKEIFADTDIKIKVFYL